MPKDDTPIDVQSLLAARSVEEHCRVAEEYFAHLDDWTHHLAKPFGSFDETPQLLINFAVVLQGLNLCPGMTVLEFGAGTCWAARILTQLGCRVIAVDVSSTALRIGQELYARHPPVGDRPAPQFLLFDGRRLDLRSQSVERVICLDAFHHVPNPAQVLKELGRVLEPGGIAGFAEPGPEHSRSPQSQYEMKTYGVVENDIDMRAIWREALSVGFTRLELAVAPLKSFYADLDQFEELLWGKGMAAELLAATRDSLANQRNFFLYKGEVKPRDSRYRQGLTAALSISPKQLVVSTGEPITLHAVVRNNSEALWLPAHAGLGAVMLGCHVYHAAGAIFRESYHWEPLQPVPHRAVQPGETVELDFQLPGLPPGLYRLVFDMVSNDVCWFAINGSQVAQVALEVVS